MKKSLLALVAVLAMLIGMVSVCGVASAETPTVTVNPTSGPIGTTFNFTCTAGYTIDIYKNGVLVAFGVGDSYQPTEAGTYTAKITEDDETYVASVDFTVTDAAPAITITGAVNGVVDPTKLTDGKLTFTTEIKWEWAYIFAANDATLSSSGHWLDYIEKAKGETFPSGQGLRNKPNGSSTGTPWTLADGDYVLWLADSSYYGDLGRVNFTIKTPVQYTGTYYVKSGGTGAGNTSGAPAALSATSVDEAIANGCTTINILGNPGPWYAQNAIVNAKPWKGTLTITGGTWTTGLNYSTNNPWKLQGDTIIDFAQNIDVAVGNTGAEEWKIIANGHKLTVKKADLQKKADSTAARNVKIVMGESKSLEAGDTVGTAYTLDIKAPLIASTKDNVKTHDNLQIYTSAYDGTGGAYTIPEDVKVILGDPTATGLEPINVSDIQLNHPYNASADIVSYKKNINIVVNNATLGKIQTGQQTNRARVAGALQIIFNNGIDGSAVNYVCEGNTQVGTGFQIVGPYKNISNKAEGTADGNAGYISNGQYIINSAKDAGCYLDTTATKGVYTVYGDKIAKAVQGDVTVYSEEGVLTVPSSGVWNVTYVDKAGETVLPTETSSCSTGKITAATYADHTVGLSFVNKLTLEEGNKLGGKAVKEIGFLVATKKNVDKYGLLLENVDNKKFLKGTYGAIDGDKFNVTFCGIPQEQIATEICGRLYVVLDDDSVVYNNITTTSFAELYNAYEDHSQFSDEINSWFEE